MTVPTAMQRSEQLLDSIAQRLHDGTLCARQLGELGEQYAAAWLESQGWQTLDRNWALPVWRTPTSSHATMRESSSSSKSKPGGRSATALRRKP